MDPLILQIYPRDVGDGTLDGASFAVQAKLWRSGAQLWSQEIKIRNHKMSDAANRAEICWFLEKHGTDDPFSVTRADSARQLLETIAADLVEDLATAKPLHADHGGILRIQIRHPAQGKCPLAALPWEILERTSGWAAAGLAFENCTVERVISNAATQEAPLDVVLKQEFPEKTEKLNILMLTARPEGSQDITGNQVSWPLARLIARWPGVKNFTFLRVVRPGTWNALVAELKAKPSGFYQIVHLDMHGQVEKDKYTLNFMSSRSRREKSKTHKVGAAKVGQLLKSHGVQIAVVNACESSKTPESGDLSTNMANIFVACGLRAVVAMSFNAMDSTVEFFVGFLYLHLLVSEKNLAEAVSGARDTLRNTSRREATLDQTLDVMDFFVPTLYRHASFDCEKFRAPVVALDIESMSFGELLQVGSGYMDLCAPSPMIGRADDIAEVEALLEICPITLIHGPGGIGKSTLLQQLQWWFKASGLVEHAIYIDLATELGQKRGHPLLQTKDQDSRLTEHLEAFLAGELNDISSCDSEVLTFFGRDPCLLVIDSLELFETKTIEQKRSLQKFLERLLENNQTGFHHRNSFILLGSRLPTALEWRANEDIGGHLLGGLSLLHGLQYGMKVLKSVYDSAPSLETKHETRAYLEHTVEILGGNPLAIELVFPALGLPGATPKSVFEEVLTGNVIPDLVTPDLDPAGQRVIEYWRRYKLGTCSRFFDDVLTMLDVIYRQGSEMNRRFSQLIGLWNCVAPSLLDILFAFFKVRFSKKGEAFHRRLEYTMVNESSVDRIKVLKSNEVQSFFQTLVDGGLIFPIEAETLLTDRNKPEYYRIHPVFTLVLRIHQEKFRQASLGHADDMSMAMVDHRLVWDCLHAKATLERYPSHQHDAQKIRALEENGRWNFVAAVIHAQRHSHQKAIIDSELSPVSRLVTPMSSLMKRYYDLGAVLRPYLVDELQRHLDSEILREDESVLYSAVKLAFTMRYGASMDTWHLIDATMQAVDAYRAKGKTYSGYLEVSYMEIRTVEAVNFLDDNPKRALSLFERNLRYEPCSNDDAMGSIRRDVLRNLQYWAMMKTTLEAEQQQSETPREEKSKPKKKPRFGEWKEETAEAFWEGTVKDSMLFQRIDPSAADSLGSFAKSIFHGAQRDVISDLAPDTKRLMEYTNGAIDSFEKMVEFAALMAGLQVRDGDSEGAKKEFRKGIERQLRSSNDLPSNFFLHSELYKLAVQEKQWSTAIRHLEQVIRHCPDESVWSFWIKIAECHEKAGQWEQARDAALAAFELARANYSSSATGLHRILACNTQLMGLQGVNDWSYIFPKRAKKASDGPFDDDHLNYCVLLKDTITVLYQDAFGDRYDRDGAATEELAARVSQYIGLFVPEGNTRFQLPEDVSDAVGGLLITMNMLSSELCDESGRTPTGLAAYAEAERCLFAPTWPKLKILADSAWARQIRQRRFPV